jgi:hypothetical protein
LPFEQEAAISGLYLPHPHRYVSLKRIGSLGCGLSAGTSGGRLDQERALGISWERREKSLITYEFPTLLADDIQ